MPSPVSFRSDFNLFRKNPAFMRVLSTNFEVSSDSDIHNSITA